MGIYYALVNMTKRERYQPANHAIKYGNFLYYAEEMLELMLGRWFGDEVRLCSDSAGDLYDESYEWPPPPAEVMLYSSPDGDNCIVNLDHNGMTKLLAEFIKVLGADGVRIAMDAAIEKAEAEK